MHKYVYVKQFNGENKQQGSGKGGGKQQGRVHSNETLNFGPHLADDLDVFIKTEYKKQIPNNDFQKLKYTINDKGELKTSDEGLIKFVKSKYEHKPFSDTTTIGGNVAKSLAEEAPEMCKSIIKAIAGRLKVHLEDALFKKRNKDSNGDFAYIAPQLGPAAKEAQSQARKRLEVKQRNAAVRGYSVKPVSVKKGQTLKHDLLDTEIIITDIDRVNPDGSIDIKYKFGDLGAFDKLKGKEELKGEDTMTITPEDLQNFNVE